MNKTSKLPWCILLLLFQVHLKGWELFWNWKNVLAGMFHNMLHEFSFKIFVLRSIGIENRNIFKSMLQSCSSKLHDAFSQNSIFVRHLCEYVTAVPVCFLSTYLLFAVITEKIHSWFKIKCQKSFHPYHLYLSFSFF